MGALNLFHDALDTLWTTVEPRMATPESLLLLKQRTQRFLIDIDSSANPLRRFATHGLERNRRRLLTAVRSLYSDSDSGSDSDSDSGSGSESTDALAAIELMFITPDTPEHAAMTDVLVRYIAVRDELVSDTDSSDSDSS
jgi:hypothetical protein